MYSRGKKSSYRLFLTEKNSLHGIKTSHTRTAKEDSIEAAMRFGRQE